MRKAFGRNNHRRGDNRPCKRPAPNFIDAANENALGAAIFRFEMKIGGGGERFRHEYPLKVTLYHKKNKSVKKELFTAPNEVKDGLSASVAIEVNFYCRRRFQGECSAHECETQVAENPRRSAW
jgi:hypothetical protein